jgi:hypothetical protein
MLLLLVSQTFLSFFDSLLAQPRPTLQRIRALHIKITFELRSAAVLVRLPPTQINRAA